MDSKCYFRSHLYVLMLIAASFLLNLLLPFVYFQFNKIFFFFRFGFKIEGNLWQLTTNFIEQFKFQGEMEKEEENNECIPKSRRSFAFTQFATVWFHGFSC